MQLFNYIEGNMEGNENLLYPEWQQHYRQALLELDQQRLRERIVAAEKAIASRITQVAGDSKHHAERRAIDDALSSLRALRREIR